MNQNEAVIVAIGRSPVTRGKKGGLAQTHPIDFGAQTLKGVLQKIPELNVSEIDDVIVGCAMPFETQGYNIARLIVERAGLPDSIPGMTINRFCSSGLQAIALCAQAIMSGQETIMIAGGIESMSTVSMALDSNTFEPWLAEHKKGAYMSMGLTAENVASKKGVTREMMEMAAAASHEKAYAAQKAGLLNEYIIPIDTVFDGERKTITQDDGIRPDTSLEKLAALTPCFLENGLVTAATSSQVSDGAGFAVIMSAQKAARLHLKPLLKFVAFSTAGVDPAYMGLGPIEAVPKVLKKAGLTINDMDTVELNEAFAAQMLPCMKELEIPFEKANPYGGAMALGHPMGATGIFLTTKALTYLNHNHGKYALITMCIGGGMGAACIMERP
ncbi:3-ketoacyl-CoA thiolase [uncultured Roseburia sp.]|uniref:acetyl-CoA C-acyltransferase n=1 Tax=Brotonthovivens ammoniilytica TaxID=2981725 RepID=A0ABT2TGN6_9FIRM|nr:thiolase family protein [Brotonthovivens ammoniilytica]MCU6760862.1 thiolase family protein [Brotonthovivens ammoniilytica]SCI11526.1 3-ketoacyl-CoA thiolase [uncultured Roseburia sp.]